ncbi:unnamed protein product [Cylindrotheca closterium]|uniref:Uncharacterized protein n=1 Tax=Cylindrotheca closterium TaxID=2856 RepID=A0AAD2G2B0_9STRA|nr:unnamed protein product [Cylindrotheca closterium]
MCRPDIPPRTSSNLQLQEEKTYVPLMNFEVGWSILIQLGVTSISFFPTEDGVDFETSVLKLKSRLREICEANPWLVGKIVKDKKRHERLMCSFPNVIRDEDVDAIFSADTLDCMQAIGRSSSYKDVAKAVRKSGAICKAGHELINNSDRVTKVSLLPINDGREIAFVFSLAHVVADGQTYYQLLNMFVDDSAIESLKVERVENFDKIVVRSIGQKEKGLLESSSLLVNLASRKLFGAPISKASANYIDQTKIAKAKLEAKEEYSKDPNFFVSTNDVITSAFANAADSSVLLMTLDLRGRVPEADKKHAGNYQTVLWYDRESYDAPAKIRQSLNQGPPFKRVSASGPLTRWQRTTASVSFISSWAFPSFDADIHLWKEDGSPSAPVSLHLPLYELGEQLPVPSAIVFKPCKGKIAMLSLYQKRNDFYKRLIASENLLGESINEDMFVS